MMTAAKLNLPSVSPLGINERSPITVGIRHQLLESGDYALALRFGSPNLANSFLEFASFGYDAML